MRSNVWGRYYFVRRRKTLVCHFAGGLSVGVESHGDVMGAASSVYDTWIKVLISTRTQTCEFTFSYLCNSHPTEAHLS